MWMIYRYKDYKAFPEDKEAEARAEFEEVQKRVFLDGSRVVLKHLEHSCDTCGCVRPGEGEWSDSLVCIHEEELTNAEIDQCNIGHCPRWKPREAGA